MLNINSKLKRMANMNCELQCMINIKHTFNVSYIQQRMTLENIYHLTSHIIFVMEERRN